MAGPGRTKSGNDDHGNVHCDEARASVLRMGERTYKLFVSEASSDLACSATRTAHARS